ncbi:hypothetical protein DPMN_051027 [Dreissena polymorpha]|uniref:Uncharacterized protein n=1 Tax=Dreissena polymorpha TaxID=45954 RepID=A0A9D4CHU4_DREPO|nr:hypothetical protein DPMN_051027 [Dreissena polymorpha]
MYKISHSADLYCHNTFLQSNLRIFDRNFKSTDHVKSDINNIKRALFNRTLPYIDNHLAKVECCTMIDIVVFAFSLLEEGEVPTSTFLKRDMKQLIIRQYGHSVTISPSSRINESDIIFSSDISADDIVNKPEESGHYAGTWYPVKKNSQGR